MHRRVDFVEIQGPYDKEAVMKKFEKAGDVRGRQYFDERSRHLERAQARRIRHQQRFILDTMPEAVSPEERARIEAQLAESET